MKKILKALFIILACLHIACKQESGNEVKSSTNIEDPHEEYKPSENLEDQVLYLTSEKFSSLSIKTGGLPKKNLAGYITANGWLDVSPQDKAAVTPLIGGNLQSIKVQEGDKVRKGDVLGYLSHPDLIKLQTDYTQAYHELTYLEQEYQRQNRLYEGNVSSGKNFEQTKSAFLSSKGMASGLASQLQLLGLDIRQIQDGKVYSEVPIISPIHGYIEEINAKIGQFAQPEQELFEIVNTDYIHADLLVFEKDAQKVKEGQTVEFAIGAAPDSVMEATVYAVGKSFEKKTKAVHIHAKIKNKNARLFPGMYISGKINVADSRVTALPEDAVISHDGKDYIFTTQKVTAENTEERVLHPVKVVTGIQDGDWIEVKLSTPLKEDQEIVWNQAYYLIAEMKKGETSHD